MNASISTWKTIQQMTQIKHECFNQYVEKHTTNDSDKTRMLQSVREKNIQQMTQIEHECFNQYVEKHTTNDSDKTLMLQSVRGKTYNK